MHTNKTNRKRKEGVMGRTVKVAEDIRIVGIKNFGGKSKMIDFFIVVPNKEKIYAFSKRYTNNTYDMCKAGIRVNDLIRRKSRDTGVMRVVNYTNLVLPYLAQEYELPLAQ